MKEQVYNKDKDQFQDSRNQCQSNLKKPKVEGFKDLASGEIVSLKILSQTWKLDRRIQDLASRETNKKGPTLFESKRCHSINSVCNHLKRLKEDIEEGIKPNLELGAGEDEEVDKQNDGRKLENVKEKEKRSKKRRVKT
ncbi:hypothetical protein Tco_0374198 [Tanacetum coccineum]